MSNASGYYVGVLDTSQPKAVPVLDDDHKNVLKPFNANNSEKSACARRYQNVKIDPTLSLTLVMEDECVACGSLSSSRRPSSDRKSPSPANNDKFNNSAKQNLKKSYRKSPNEYDVLLNRINARSPGELAKTLTVSMTSIMSAAQNRIPCIGCRTNVLELCKNIRDNPGAVRPLVLTEGGKGGISLTMEKSHLLMPGVLARLFTEEIFYLDEQFQSMLVRPAERAKSSTFRCSIHTTKRVGFQQNMWWDIWDKMAPNCRKKVLALPFDKLKTFVETYLRKHKFCTECSHMVHQAFFLLTGERSCKTEPTKCNRHVEPLMRSAVDKHSHSEDDLYSTGRHSPALPGDDSHCCCCGGKTSRADLFEGLEANPNKKVVNIEASETFVDKLIEMAVPEISGDSSEKHAKSLEVAQKEVCTCIGLALYNRFKDCYMALRETVQAADWVLLTALQIMKYELEQCSSTSETSVDALVDELNRAEEEDERRKQHKREKKSEKKAKQKAKKKLQREQMTIDVAAALMRPPPPPSSSRGDSGTLSAEASPPPPPPPLINYYDFSKNLNLIHLFQYASPESEDDLQGEEAIPDEDIAEYRANVDQVKRKIEEIHTKLEQEWQDVACNNNMCFCRQRRLPPGKTSRGR